MTDWDVTPTVDEYLEAEKRDRNLWWRISCGHHQNLFDQAVEERDVLRAKLQAAERLAALIPSQLDDGDGWCWQCGGNLLFPEGAYHEPKCMAVPLMEAAAAYRAAGEEAP